MAQPVEHEPGPLHWLERFQAGDQSARDKLLEHFMSHLRKTAKVMLRGFPKVHDYEQTDDVLQNALIRLMRSMDHHAPRTVPEFLGFVTLQIRRELLDLARHYSGPYGLGTNQINEGALDGSEVHRSGSEPSNSTFDPSRLAMWTEFHERVLRLPDQPRQVFRLRYYAGFTCAEAAQALNISESTAYKAWVSACRRLRHVLEGTRP